MMKEAVSICNQAGPAVELLWASTREVFNIVQADQIGCKIITSPADLIKKIPAFGKSMEQLSLETVKTFKADAESAGFSL
jgi:transaldolase